ALELVNKVQADMRLTVELQILELIGDTYYWVGAMSDSASAYEKQTDRAARAGRQAEQVQALGRLAMPLGFIDPDRGLAATKQAVQLSFGPNDLRLLALSRLLSSGYSLVYDAWRGNDFEVWTSTFEELCAYEDKSLPAYHRNLHSYVLLLQGDYRRALGDLQTESQNINRSYNLMHYIFVLR